MRRPIRHQTCGQAEAVQREGLADQTVIPTPGAVLLASELLAKGSYEQEGVGGVILGRSLLEGKFTAQEAIACWQDA